jgi:hypothetical protein
VIGKTSISAPRVLTNQFVQMDVLTIFATNIVEASIDLSNWTSIATNIAPEHAFGILDTNATNFDRRFYRVRGQ